MIVVLKKHIFKISSEANLNYALFLKDFRTLPMRMATYLTKMKELYPSWSNKSVAFYLAK
jgi:hypothetical protein